MDHACILLVEDDRDIRETLAEALMAEGFGVVAVENGLEALKVLRGDVFLPSVILLDLMMPVLDGYAFLAERAKDRALSRIPVAVLTASHQVRGDLLGDVPIVWKPMDLPVLLDLLRELLRDGTRGESCSGACPPFLLKRAADAA